MGLVKWEKRWDTPKGTIWIVGDCDDGDYDWGVEILNEETGLECWEFKGEGSRAEAEKLFDCLEKYLDPERPAEIPVQAKRLMKKFKTWKKW